MSSKHFTFSKGVHFADMKGLSKDKAITVMPTVDNYFVSTSQHIGAPSVPVVAPNDIVVQGQLIAKAASAVSANIYSPISGTVAEIVTRKNIDGNDTSYIHITADKNNTKSMLLPPMKEVTKQSIIDRIKEAGIVGLGGAGFPTAIKLVPDKAVDTLIINAAECEPYLTCDYRVMLEKSQAVYEGAKLAAAALGVSRIIFGIEDNKTDIYEIFVKFSDIETMLLKAKYPQGSEKQLIFACTERKVPPKKLPKDVGVVVQNVQTVFAIYDAVKNNKPLYERVLTVSGKGIKETANLLVKVGTPYADIISHCGGITEDAVKLIAGGPMTGHSSAQAAEATTKTDGGLLVLNKSEAFTASPTPCIKCGRCVMHCPMNLMPLYIDFYTLAGDTENAIKYGALDCFECGTCAYVCPAARQIVQCVKLTKLKAKEKK